MLTRVNLRLFFNFFKVFKVNTINYRNGMITKPPITVFIKIINNVNIRDIPYLKKHNILVIVIPIVIMTIGT